MSISNYGTGLSLRGEFLSLKLTPANTDDRRPVPKITKDVFGKLFGDKGYIYVSALVRGTPPKRGAAYTELKRNMKNKLMSVSVMDKLLLRKRAVIETVQGNSPIVPVR